MYELTGEIVRADIKVFEARISALTARLESLPVGYLPYKQHKRREAKRLSLQAEIRRAQGFIGMIQKYHG